ncbi:MAG TPA: GH1 family beta-glucosidase [Anaeromyxobacter sp.]|nr:GH1 family beta-glucosidase [Anaeromyxobacter sp.]
MSPQRRSARAPFPEDFLWGAATAAYQIEGAVQEDGRAPSVWDAFSAKPGAVTDGDTGAVACDHYHRHREDVALMKRLGLRAYRFSVAWPRVLPEGTGAPNEKGLDFYDRLVDDLLRAGVQPSLTLYHWDLPVALHARGGWLNRDVASWFADYATLVARRLGDRVKLWGTLNEPAVFVVFGYDVGKHAPGERRPRREVLLAAHNALRGHARAVQALRAAAPDGKIGWALNISPANPATDAPADVEAARRVLFRVEEGELWPTAWWSDPVLEGRYPEDGLAVYRKDMPEGFEADLAEMKQPIDWLGLNIYSGSLWRAGADGEPEQVALPPGYPRSAVIWQRILPQSLYWGPRFYHERTGLPIHITENGVSTREWISLDGEVHDPGRADYLHRVLLEIARARRDGVPVDAYFHWSLIDNFEWAEGYKERFGLVYVDYSSQRRIPKDSYAFYRKVIATNGRALLGKTAMPATRVVDEG